MNVSSLFSYWASSYYTLPLAMMTALVGVVIFLLKSDKKNSTHIFLYYFVAYFLLNQIFSASALFTKKPLQALLIEADHVGDYIFTLLEFLIFFIFLKKELYGSRYKKILTAICFVFIIIGTIFFLRDIFLTGKTQLRSTYFLFNLEAVSLLIPCISYYTEIFQSKPSLDLLQEPSFWIVIGLSFFMISTLPLSLSIDYLRRIGTSLSQNLFTLFYIFYIILFLMIIRAQLCKRVMK